MKNVEKVSQRVHRLSARVITAAAVFSAFGAGIASAAVPPYSIAPLTDVGATDVYANAVNASGVVAGYTVDVNGVSHATVWTDGVPKQLQNLAGGASEAFGINASGQVVGKAFVDANYAHAVVWDANGNVTDLGTIANNFGSFANAISDDGTVVGGSNSATGNLHAFVYTAGTGMVDYGTFNPTDKNYYAGWNAINSSGKLAGTGYRLFSPYHGSMGQVGTIGVTDISPAAQFSTGMALGINDAGTIVGYQNPTGRGSPLPAIFNEDGTVTPLSLTPLGFAEGWAEDINNDGVVVGRAFGVDKDGNFDQHAYVYINGEMIDLLDIVGPNSGWTQFFNGAAINDDGTIVGSGVYNGELSGFVLTVVPEPTTLGLAAITAVAFVRRTRR